MRRFQSYLHPEKVTELPVVARWMEFAPDDCYPEFDRSQIDLKRLLSMSASGQLEVVLFTK